MAVARFQPQFTQVIVLGIYTLTWCTSSRAWTLPTRPSSHHVVASAASRDFDFSSILGWNNFYQQDDAIVEWHSSIPLEALMDYIPKGSSCLIIGCGNSRLPKAIYDVHGSETKICCLDSSQTCLDQLKQQWDFVESTTSFQSTTNRTLSCSHPDCVSFVCGDAVELTKTLGPDTNFDRIIDKGLMDALLCGEGWNAPVERLLRESIQVLSEGGQYLLISYRLPKSTEAFLQTVTTPALQWSFHLDNGHANERVQISLATKISN
ncbi:hypothetical protein MHU86_24266 [Fragilaria crotonensis]|nr:hypothetical protein MHU86_24266 [Fragilaria crotonensis]